MRKPGWYWVKWENPGDLPSWCPSWWCEYAHAWWVEECFQEEDDIVEIGPRIPTPDEPWQCVPVEPTEPMLQTLHDKVLISCNPAKKTASILNDTKLWGHVLAAAPKPETQP